MAELVTLVDANDRIVGHVEKLEAHREAMLHRACSVVLFNHAGEMLLQRRSATKYHSGGLWSNTCCTHPRPSETPIEAATRRLQEEMGIASDLTFLFSFVYRAELDGGMIESEVDHVFGGVVEGDPEPNWREVNAWRWTSVDEVLRDVQAHPQHYTRWFPIILDRLLDAGYETFRPFQLTRPVQ